ncbi:hypothetical protein [Actinomadura bangladeshensis]|uniref:Uncharacterized protein n=1 Tax=Actinomadura bangladeshensis TaxID=453573 RepID=A0A6L9QAG9_9ACTN|nr:hypothetical protein [Actinomadura bangladeshensis]NEA22195.1 hypothetical protein [Actinomadura bangladeshensis]
MKPMSCGLEISLGEGAHLDCYTYPEDSKAGPILVIFTAGMAFSLTNRARGAVEAGDVQNARRLLEVVTRFTAEVERLHALNSGATDSAENAAA